MIDEPIKVLLIEDNPDHAQLIQELLAQEISKRFDLACAARLSTGLRLLAKRRIDVVLLDLSLPDGQRLDTFVRVRDHAPQLPIIVLTSLDDKMLAVKAVQQGAQDYLVKGRIDSNLLGRALLYAIARKQLEEALKQSEERYRTLFQYSGTAMAIAEDDMTISQVNKEFEQLTGYSKNQLEGKMIITDFLAEKDKQRIIGYYKALRQGKKISSSYKAKIKRKDNQIRTIFATVGFIPGTKNSMASLTDITDQERTERELKKKSNEIGDYARQMRMAYNALERAYLDTIHALVISVETRDPYTYGHSERVTQYSKEIAKKMGWKDKGLNSLELACRIHDIGKIGVSDRIMLKSGALTTAEWAVMKMHPVKGAEMLTFSEYFKPVIPIVRHHHERWNGKGYPDGLKGKKIPPGARILAIADTFDAMSSARPYRDAIDYRKIVKNLKESAGTQFDPQIVKIWLEIMEKYGIPTL